MNEVIKKYINIKEKDLIPQSIEFINDSEFNFAYDIVDEYAKSIPDELAMLYVSATKEEKRFTYKDMSILSSKTANYLSSLGIKKGDKVMLMLKRHYQFWFCLLALHKIGAIAIPSNNMLVKKDILFRVKSANIDAVICSSADDILEHVDDAIKDYDGLKVKISVGDSKSGWHDFDSEMNKCSEEFERVHMDSNEPMLMFFTSGTSAYPKKVIHNFKYPLGHYFTAKYWHNVQKKKLHFTLAETGWAKALWGKIYGQWMCETPVFVYDFNVFDPSEIMALVEKYKIATFCAPSTMYRLLSRMDFKKYDFSSVKHVTSAGEPLSKEVFEKFRKVSGLAIHEGFGQTETTLTIGNMSYDSAKSGSIGKCSPMYNIKLLLRDGSEAKTGEIGEIAIDIRDGKTNGLFAGYYCDDNNTKDAFEGGYYRTNDMAYKDMDGYFWYVGRADDIIKSAGYRIGPIEIESVINQLPYVSECAVTAIPDKVRGKAIKAIVVLNEGLSATQSLKNEIWHYVRDNMASYKWPKIVEFKNDLPKTNSGKIKRCEL